jgi:hypothetical protein
VPEGETEDEWREAVKLVVTEIEMPERRAVSPARGGSATTIPSQQIVGELEQLQARVSLPGVQRRELS